PNVVSSGRGDISDGQSCIDRVVELGELADPRRHQAAGVQKNHDVLTSFDRVLSRYELAAARSSGPRDVANFIADHKLAQGLKLPALPADSHSPEPGFRAPVAMRVQLVLLGFADVRIDSYIASRRVGHLPPDQTHLRPESNG